MQLYYSQNIVFRDARNNNERYTLQCKFIGITKLQLHTSVGPLALTNDKIYGLSNVNGPASGPL